MTRLRGRVSKLPYKDPADFVLWKPSTPDPTWLELPLGDSGDGMAYRMLCHGRKTSGIAN